MSPDDPPRSRHERGPVIDPPPIDADTQLPVDAHDPADDAQAARLLEGMRTRNEGADDSEHEPDTGHAEPGHGAADAPHETHAAGHEHAHHVGPVEPILPEGFRNFMKGTTKVVGWTGLGIGAAGTVGAVATGWSAGFASGGLVGAIGGAVLTPAGMFAAGGFLLWAMFGGASFIFKKMTGAKDGAPKPAGGGGGGHH